LCARTRFDPAEGCRPDTIMCVLCAGSGDCADADRFPLF
jgi:hypothetical protein